MKESLEENEAADIKVPAEESLFDMDVVNEFVIPMASIDTQVSSTHKDSVSGLKSEIPRDSAISLEQSIAKKPKSTKPKAPKTHRNSKKAAFEKGSQPNKEKSPEEEEELSKIIQEIMGAKSSIPSSSAYTPPKDKPAKSASEVKAKNKDMSGISNHLLDINC